MAGSGTRNFHAVGLPERRGRIPLAAWFLPVGLILLSAAISHRVTRTTGTFIESPPPSILFALSKRPTLAFGFRNLLADVAWLQAVQVSGNLKMRKADYDLLAQQLDTVLGFDPRFMVPYHVGGIVLGDSTDHAPAALSILARGEKVFPLEWRMPFYASYIQYFSLGNAMEGGTALLRASRIPGSPQYFPLLAARMFSEGNRPETALSFLRELVDNEKDSRRIAVLEERIRQVVVERDLQLLEGAVSEYKAREGAFPGRIADLVASGVIDRIPEDPYGGKYMLTPDGRVRSDRAPAGRLKVLRKP